jgi:hypothetical protein
MGLQNGSANRQAEPGAGVLCGAEVIEHTINYVWCRAWPIVVNGNLHLTGGGTAGTHSDFPTADRRIGQRVERIMQKVQYCMLNLYAIDIDRGQPVGKIESDMRA